MNFIAANDISPCYLATQTETVTRCSPGEVNVLCKWIFWDVLIFKTLRWVGPSGAPHY